MAFLCQTVFLLVVCGLVQCIGAVCNVSCTSDYFSSLNCSISASEEPVSCDVEANCRDIVGSTQGSCVIKPPNQWCIIAPEGFYEIAELDTECTITAKPSGSQSGVQNYTSRTVQLTSIIKPPQPFNLTLTKRNGSEDFILSWKMPYVSDVYGLENDLMYSVCLRPKHDQDKESCYLPFNIIEDRKYLEIECRLLSPGEAYVASVKASANPQHYPNAHHWSEWSTSAELTCPNTDSPDLTGANCYLVFLFGLVALPFVLLIYFGKQGRLKKLGLFQYIPNPQDFFKPLYHTYQGDFKKWVGPVLTFNSLEILEKSVPLQVLSEKQLQALPLQRELLQESPISGGSSRGDWSLLSLVNPNSSKHSFFGDSSPGTTHSSGHISMDTVTVSGQEGTMSDWSGGSDRNRPDPGNLRAPGVSDEEDVLELDGGDDFANDGDNIEVISLDSYSSNEHSDDGYPQVGLDLDTIDSGFLESECSSPMNSECDGSDQMEVALLGGGVCSHSNYVKQWVAFNPASEDNMSTNSEQ